VKKVSKKYLTTPEGAVFLAPLPTRVLIRKSGRPACFGAFFGPRVTNSRNVGLDKIRVIRDDHPKTVDYLNAARDLK
jgi:hypothetical protein